MVAVGSHRSQPYFQLGALTPLVALKSYIGFFSLLWFTWFQVALFDVRFGRDSIFERLCKVIQFGIMVGLSVEGPNYNLDRFNPKSFGNLSLILMVSRLVLASQYAVAWWWLRKCEVHLPLLAHVVTMFVSAMVLLGLHFAIVGPPGVHAIDGWYVLLSIEAVAILFISRTTFLNFKKTIIIERLGLLTLIILGEGVMGLGESVSKIHDADGIFSADMVGMIICAVLIAYFLFMLYFDQNETKRGKVGSFDRIEIERRKVGPLRQLIWALGHLPFHVCILLVVAGFSQFTVWRRIVDYTNAIFNNVNAIPIPTSNTTAAWEGYAAAINVTLIKLWPGLDFTNSLAGIANSSGNLDDVGYYITAIMGTVAQVVAEDWFGVEVPTVFNEAVFNVAVSEGFNDFANISILYSAVYLYFFISAGLALIILACLFMLGKKAKSRVEYISIGIRLLVGTGLALVATMFASTAANTISFYFFSPWMTPTVVLAYALGKSKTSLS